LPHDVSHPVFCRDIKRAEPASFGSPATAIRIGNPRTGSLERQYWLVVNVSRIRHLSSRRGWSVMPRFDPNADDAIEDSGFDTDKFQRLKRQKSGFGVVFRGKQPTLPRLRFIAPR
jgi:hypothetical protein